ncbi:MAG TPA: isocitrate lyase/phosphoenolpyruvate mutase family protein, partial [Phenylobacterium sp.]
MSQAELFRKLHEGPRVLVLPNAWDAASAALMADAGAKAVA